MCPCPCQGLQLVEEIRFPPQQLLQSPGWTSSVPGLGSILPLCCCVTLGKQLTLSESLFSSLEHQGFGPCGLRSFPARPLIRLDPWRRRRRRWRRTRNIRAGFPTGDGSPHLIPKGGSS